MRLFERALRRARLPLAMSQGFNPRPRLSLPMPLSVGISGLNEVADVRLRRWIRPEQIRARLQAELPEGIEIASVQTTPLNASRQPSEASYRVPLLPGHTLTQDKIRQVLACKELVVRRARKEGFKEVEIRQFIKALRLADQAVLMLLSCTQSGTARSEEVLAALDCREGVDYLKGEIVRTNVNLSS